jgi:sugar phosphate isomerase/epimerase
VTAVPRYAARLNAFPGGHGVVGRIAAAGRVGGLTHVDLNYPDHLQGVEDGALRDELRGAGLVVNGMAMRFGARREFHLGAFTHPEEAVRRAAIDLTKRGIDAGRDLGARLMTLWMGQDGFDYPLQMDYERAWDRTVEALVELAAHDPGTALSIEYKPNEPRAYALLPDMATTLLMLTELRHPNLGVTVDFAHMLYAGEMPAKALQMAAKRTRILGVHLNDAYGKRDDGLMVGSVHPVETVEFLMALLDAEYDGVLYFDTFPDHGGMDPIAEARANIAQTGRLMAVAEALRRDTALSEARAAQDAAAVLAIVQGALRAP